MCARACKLENGARIFTVMNPAQKLCWFLVAKCVCTRGGWLSICVNCVNQCVRKLKWLDTCRTDGGRQRCEAVIHQVYLLLGTRAQGINHKSTPGSARSPFP